jgi:hypothetical protein
MLTYVVRWVGHAAGLVKALGWPSHDDGRLADFHAIDSPVDPIRDMPLSLSSH